MTRRVPVWLPAVAIAGTPAAMSCHTCTESVAPPAARPQVVFACPHGAAKSVLAAAYFGALAAERGLAIDGGAVGTEPDDAIAPAVAEHLARLGIEPPMAKPRRAAPGEVAGAAVVVSMGCDLRELAAPPARVRVWDDVPPLSQDFDAADRVIRERVRLLVDELAERGVAAHL